MGFFDGLKAESEGRKAYGLHVQANRLYDQDKLAEAREKEVAAREHYGKYEALGGNKPSILMAYGVLLLRFGEFDKAKELFLKCEKAPGLTKQDKQQLRVNFAIAQWKKGDLDSAIQQLQYALRDAKTGMIYGSLGYILIEKARQTGDFDEAVALNTEALAYDEEDAVVLDNMGQLNLAMGDKEKAFEYFTKAHEQKPKQVDTLYYLALLTSERGETDKAIGYLDTALNSRYSPLCTTTREQAMALKAKLEGKG